MDYLKILDEIYKLIDEYKILLEDFKKLNIFNSANNSYLKKDKDELREFWLRYIVFFEKIKKILRKTKYRKYLFFIDYNKLALRKYLTHFYYKVTSDLLENFWKHEIFIRNFLSENFKTDYIYYSNYIYNPRFINIYNTPIVFIFAFKKSIHPKIKVLLFHINQIYTNKRLFVDYDNLYYNVSNNLLKVVYIISKAIWISLSNIRFTKRKKWLINSITLEKYLKIWKPGDIFLSRWNRNATNITIPWFWKHMSMYLWTWKQIKENYPYYYSNDIEDSENYIVEATWAGINIVNIKNFAFRNDYLWVFRTKFKQEKINRAIKSALNNVWKSYDFIFNFYSDNKFVCSALIMKSYAKEYEGDEWIDINLKKFAFSLTYPPNNFVKEFAEESLQNKSEIKAVFFIDSIEKTWKNFINTKKELKESYKRSRFTFFLK